MESGGIRLICYGHDEMLLFTRQQILKKEFSVQICDGLARLGELLVQGPVQLVVLCQSVPDWECDEVIELSRAAWPEVKFLALHEAVLGGCSTHSDGTIAGLEGPPALLHEVHALLRTAAAQNTAQRATL